MRKTLLALTLACAFALAPVALVTAHADVVMSPMLSGTGDNVTFESFAGSLAIGQFNGQHTGVVNFSDLSGNSLFAGAANGNDIKISNTSDLQIEVFSNTSDTQVLTTSTQVFSLKGSGDVHAIVQATDGTFNIDLGQITANAQSGFTLTAINGETMNLLTLVDATGEITDYEHYRIDVAGPLVATPLPASLPLMFGGLGLMGWLTRRRKALA
jgi:hypothetical protein